MPDGRRETLSHVMEKKKRVWFGLVWFGLVWFGFWPCPVAWGILVPQPGIEFGPSVQMSNSMES